MHEAILEEIKQDLFAGKTPVEFPQIFILGGQPGSGKSVLSQQVCNQIPDQNIVIINGDEFRTLHPQAQEIFSKHDKDFASYTDSDVRTWVPAILEQATDQHYNVVFEGTMRTTQICDTIKNLQRKNYKINIMAMAVPEIKSRISIYARYQDQLDHIPIARFTSKESHDAAYSGMLDTLQYIEENKLYDNILICNRNGDILFKNGDKDIVTAIEKERNRPLSVEETKDLMADCDILLDKMKKRDEKQEYIEDLSGLRHQLSSEKNVTKTINNLRGVNTSSFIRKPSQQSNIDINTLKYLKESHTK